MSGKNNSRGVAIPTVLFVLLIVLIMGLAVSTTGIQNLRNVKKSILNDKALYAAEAGLQTALAQLRVDNELNGLSAKEHQLPSGEANFSVWICNRFSNPNTPIPSEIQEKLGSSVSIPLENAYILARGEAADSVRYVGMMVKLSEDPGMGLGYPAVAGDRSLDLNNLNLDSYDSNDPANEGKPITSYAILDNRGHAGTNATGWVSGLIVTSAGQLGINGSVFMPDFLKGESGVYKFQKDPAYGVKYYEPNLMMPIESPDRITDDLRTIPATNILTPGDYRDVGDLTLTRNYTLDGPGTYIFKGLHLTGSGQINFKYTGAASDEPVNIIFDGDVSIGGTSSFCFISDDPVLKPGKIQVYGTENCNAFEIRGNPDSAFVVYAPSANIDFKGSSTHIGALIGKTINVSGNANTLLYDVDLENTRFELIPRPPKISSVSWQRF
jgi:hypothetical protein